MAAHADPSTHEDGMEEPPGPVVVEQDPSRRYSRVGAQGVRHAQPTDPYAAILEQTRGHAAFSRI